jgi:hypothetical protein
LREDLAQLLVIHEVVEPIRAEEQQIARLESHLGLMYIEYLGTPEVLGEQIPVGVGSCLLIAEEAFTNLQIDPTVVNREAVDLSIA